MIIKKTKRIFVLLSVFSAGLMFYSCNNVSNSQNSVDMPFPKDKPDKEWKEVLTPFQYSVLRESATERPFTGEYYDSKDTGTYYCAGCGDKLFRSDAKFDSACGWPSFFEPESKNSIVQKTDHSHGMIRTEIVCGGCGGHLGHVFNDGPPPTGLRYCINSASLIFKKEDKNTK